MLIYSRTSYKTLACERVRSINAWHAKILSNWMYVHVVQFVEVHVYIHAFTPGRYVFDAVTCYLHVAVWWHWHSATHLRVY
jgi:hypothetical protein